MVYFLLLTSFLGFTVNTALANVDGGSIIIYI